jgi:hypothetical protein
MGKAVMSQRQSRSRTFAIQSEPGTRPYLSNPVTPAEKGGILLNGRLGGGKEEWEERGVTRG